MTSIINYLYNFKDNYIKGIIEDQIGKYLKDKVKLESKKMTHIKIKKSDLNESNINEDFLQNTPFLLQKGSIEELQLQLNVTKLFKEPIDLQANNLLLELCLNSQKTYQEYLMEIKQKEKEKKKNNSQKQQNNQQNKEEQLIDYIQKIGMKTKIKIKNIAIKLYLNNEQQKKKDSIYILIKLRQVKTYDQDVFKVSYNLDHSQVHNLNASTFNQSQQLNGSVVFNTTQINDSQYNQSKIQQNNDEIDQNYITMGFALQSFTIHIIKDQDIDMNKEYSNSQGEFPFVYPTCYHPSTIVLIEDIKFSFEKSLENGSLNFNFNMDKGIEAIIEPFQLKIILEFIERFQMKKKIEEMYPKIRKNVKIVSKNKHLLNQSGQEENNVKTRARKISIDMDQELQKDEEQIQQQEKQKEEVFSALLQQFQDQMEQCDQFHDSFGQSQFQMKQEQSYVRKSQIKIKQEILTQIQIKAIYIQLLKQDIKCMQKDDQEGKYIDFGRDWINKDKNKRSNYYGYQEISQSVPVGYYLFKIKNCTALMTDHKKQFSINTSLKIFDIDCILDHDKHIKDTNIVYGDEFNKNNDKKTKNKDMQDKDYYISSNFMAIDNNIQRTLFNINNDKHFHYCVKPVLKVSQKQKLKKQNQKPMQSSDNIKVKKHQMMFSKSQFSTSYQKQDGFQETQFYQKIKNDDKKILKELLNNNVKSDIQQQQSNFAFVFVIENQNQRESNITIESGKIYANLDTNTMKEFKLILEYEINTKLYKDYYWDKYNDKTSQKQIKLLEEAKNLSQVNLSGEDDEQFKNDKKIDLFAEIPYIRLVINQPKVNMHLSKQKVEKNPKKLRDNPIFINFHKVNTYQCLCHFDKDALLFSKVGKNAIVTDINDLRIYFSISDQALNIHFGTIDGYLGDFNNQSCIKVFNIGRNYQNGKIIENQIEFWYEMKIKEQQQQQKQEFEQEQEQGDFCDIQNLQDIIDSEQMDVRSRRASSCGKDMEINYQSDYIQQESILQEQQNYETDKFTVKCQLALIQLYVNKEIIEKLQQCVDGNLKIFGEIDQYQSLVQKYNKKRDFQNIKKQKLVNIRLFSLENNIFLMPQFNSNSGQHQEQQNQEKNHEKKHWSNMKKSGKILKKEITLISHKIQNYACFHVEQLDLSSNLDIKFELNFQRFQKCNEMNIKAQGGFYDLMIIDPFQIKQQINGLPDNFGDRLKVDKQYIEKDSLFLNSYRAWSVILYSLQNNLKTFHKKKYGLVNNSNSNRSYFENEKVKYLIQIKDQNFNQNNVVSLDFQFKNNSTRDMFINENLNEIMNINLKQLNTQNLILRLSDFRFRSLINIFKDFKGENKKQNKNKKVNFDLEEINIYNFGIDIWMIYQFKMLMEENLSFFYKQIMKFDFEKDKIKNLEELFIGDTRSILTISQCLIKQQKKEQLVDKQKDNIKEDCDIDELDFEKSNLNENEYCVDSESSQEQMSEQSSCSNQQQQQQKQEIVVVKNLDIKINNSVIYFLQCYDQCDYSNPVLLNISKFTPLNSFFDQYNDSALQTLGFQQIFSMDALKLQINNQEEEKRIHLTVPCIQFDFCKDSIYHFVRHLSMLKLSLQDLIDKFKKKSNDQIYKEAKLIKIEKEQFKISESDDGVMKFEENDKDFLQQEQQQNKNNNNNLQEEQNRKFSGNNDDDDMDEHQKYEKKWNVEQIIQVLVKQINLNIYKGEDFYFLKPENIEQFQQQKEKLKQQKQFEKEQLIKQNKDQKLLNKNEDIQQSNKIYKRASSSERIDPIKYQNLNQKSEEIQKNNNDNQDKNQGLKEFLIIDHFSENSSGGKKVMKTSIMNMNTQQNMIRQRKQRRDYQNKIQFQFENVQTIIENFNKEDPIQQRLDFSCQNFEILDNPNWSNIYKIIKKKQLESKNEQNLDQVEQQMDQLQSLIIFKHRFDKMKKYPFFNVKLDIQKPCKQNYENDNNQQQVLCQIIDKIQVIVYPKLQIFVNTQTLEFLISVFNYKNEFFQQENKFLQNQQIRQKQQILMQQMNYNNREQNNEINPEDFTVIIDDSEKNQKTIVNKQIKFCFINSFQVEIFNDQEDFNIKEVLWGKDIKRVIQLVNIGEFKGMKFEFNDFFKEEFSEKEIKDLVKNHYLQDLKSQGFGVMRQHLPIIKNVSNLASGIFSLVSEPFSSYQQGQSIGEGTIRGLKNLVKSVGEESLNLTQGLISGMAKLVGIKKPQTLVNKINETEEEDDIEYTSNLQNRNKKYK